MSTIQLSVVVPLYKCAPFIKELTERLIKSLSSISPNFEVIFVNDNSPLNDWELVKEVSRKNERIKGINLSRNFGQHYAITAGLEHANGDWVVVMDGDLQDQPEEIKNLYNKSVEGYDIVFAKRKDRKDSFFKRMGSKLFYKVLAYLTDTEQNAEIANFGIYSKKVVQAILSMRDYTRYFPTMVKWVGFNSAEIIVTHNEREEGKSGYSFSTLLKLALNTILSFSDKPIRLTVKLGIIISCLAFIFALYVLYRSLTHQISVSGYSSLIISIWFLSGIIITTLGIVGLYIGRMFDQVKNRPTYIVKDSLNLNVND